MKSVFLVGNGNVAFHLKRALKRNGYILTGKAEDCDLVIFSVADDAYASVIKDFPVSGKMMVHTSGSLPSTILASKTNRYGVLYPYQSLSKADTELSFREVPVLVTGSDSAVENSLLELAGNLSEMVRKISDEQRLKLHIAAVFANNFSNHLIAIAQKILNENDLDTGLLVPLIKKTFSRLEKQPDAAKLQTGPAIRGDKTILEKHLKLLESNPDWQKIYRFVSQSIQHTNKIDEKF